MTSVEQRIAGEDKNPVLVIGIGNPYRGDDAAGNRVVQLLNEKIRAAGFDDTKDVHGPGLHAVALEADVIELMAAWQNHNCVVLVDAVGLGIPTEPDNKVLDSSSVVKQDKAMSKPVDLPIRPGDRFLWNLELERLPELLDSNYSTHGMGIGQLIDLCRSLGKIPKQLFFIGIAGESFNVGESLSQAVEQAVNRVALDLFQQTEGAYARIFLDDRAT